MLHRLAPLVALVVVACEAPAPPASSAPSAPPRATTTTAPIDDVTWVERVPDGVAADASLPLVVGVHGLGDAPGSFCRVFDDLRVRARIACPRAFARFGRGWSWFPVDADDATRAAAIAAAADRLGAAIDRLAAARKTTGKPVVTGFSQGGALAFALAVRRPGSIARAIPVGGWLSPSSMPPEGARVAPITALHGEQDTRVPPGPTRAIVEALTARGADASIRTFPGVGHTIPPAVRSALHGAIERTLDAAGRTGEGTVP